MRGAVACRTYHMQALYSHEIATHAHFPAWSDYHENNPSTYEFFCTMARAAKAKGFRRGSIKHLIEIGRWERGFDFRLASGFQHEFAPLYARLIMSIEPDLRGFFETRMLIATVA